MLHLKRNNLPGTKCSRVRLFHNSIQSEGAKGSYGIIGDVFIQGYRAKNTMLLGTLFEKGLIMDESSSCFKYIAVLY